MRVDLAKERTGHLIRGSKRLADYLKECGVESVRNLRDRMGPTCFDINSPYWFEDGGFIRLEEGSSIYTRARGCVGLTYELSGEGVILGASLDEDLGNTQVFFFGGDHDVKGYINPPREDERKDPLYVRVLRGTRIYRLRQELERLAGELEKPQKSV